MKNDCPPISVAYNDNSSFLAHVTCPSWACYSTTHHFFHSGTQSVGKVSVWDIDGLRAERRERDMVNHTQFLLSTHVTSAYMWLIMQVSWLLLGSTEQECV